MARNLEEHYKIKSNYLTPIKYPHHFSTSFYINIYQYEMGYKSVPKYLTTIKSDIVSGSITKDKSSTFLSSCDLEIIVSEECQFTLSENYNWSNKFIAIYKEYEFPNNCYYRNPNFPDGLSSYDVSDYYNSAVINMGYYKVDSLSYSYSSSSRTLSLSGTDVISVLGETHGGGLIDYITGQKDITGFTAEATNTVYHYINEVLDRYSPIYFDDRFTYATRVWMGETWDLPYDFEFGSDVTALTMLQKLQEIQESLYLYVGNNFRFFITPVISSWVEPTMATVTMGKQISELVIEESRSINLTDIYNYCIVYGKEHYVYRNNFGNVVTEAEAKALGEGNYSVQLVIPKAEYGLDYSYMNTDDWYRLEGNPFAINKIGLRKKMITDENCLTDEHCKNKGKWNIYQNTMFRETVTIKLVDNSNPIFITSNGWEALGVGTRIEYTSIVTGETNVYLINKVTHNLTECVWVLDLQPFRPLMPDMPYAPDGVGYPYNPVYDEQGNQLTTWRLANPTINIEYEENGIVNFTVNNGEFTEFSLFKFYNDNKFIGETCIEDSEEINKIFSFQFKDNGTYIIEVLAYSPQYPPSNRVSVFVNVTNVTEPILTDEVGKVITNEADIILTK